MDRDSAVHLQFDAGTLILQGSESAIAHLPGVQFDARTGTFRAEAIHYRAIVEQLRAEKRHYTDQARNYEPTPWPIRELREPFPHQRDAVRTWWEAEGRGVVVLPTGTGKTHVAILAIAKAGRPTLVVAPTIDLLNQWYGELVKVFGDPVGLLGGGHHDLRPLTVTTYDSAYIYLEKWGNRFGLLICDECHHLPGSATHLIARGCIAPFRLGLTATPERADGLHALLPELLGPIIFRREIRELAGAFLAEYETRRLYVALDPDDFAQYQACRQLYRDFLQERGIQLSAPNGLQRFIQESTRSEEGRRAFQAFREQKRLQQAAPEKLVLLGELLQRHRGERTLIFTADNATVYRIARQYLVPAITHQTKTRERKRILEAFHRGEFTVLVTSQVLNEGVDVPSAGVAIILSGTGSVREHVQRLGRILRKYEDKQAILYEIVTRDTAEELTSRRRRQHDAYEPDRPKSD